ncbi:MAG: hypothetical protein WC764_01980 [Candidatus Paceibacterota bacterium]|jgi:hypothetical protein
MTSENYTLPDEEVQKAEESLTPDQASASRIREESFRELESIFHKQGISLENLRDIDLTVEQAVQFGLTNLKGSINGHKILVACTGSGADLAFFEGKVDGLTLNYETGCEFVRKYAPVVEYLAKYNKSLDFYRSVIKREQESFNDQQKIEVILKDIL